MRNGLAALAGALLLLGCTFYPFLPGSYDPTAIAVSLVAQTLGALGLPLALLGTIWIAGHLRARRRAGSLHQPGRAWVVVTLAWGGVMAMAVIAVVVVQAGYFGAAVAVVASVWLLASWRRHLLRSRPSAAPVPATAAGMALVPIAVLVGQWSLAGPATRSSQERAIASSAALVADLEDFRGRFGFYPESLLAVHEDYEANVIGIDGYGYVRNGESFNLFFEQPRIALEDLGIREFVVYNPRDEHIMLSHAAWFLAGPPERLRERQGWSAVREAGVPSWRRFLFD